MLLECYLCLSLFLRLTLNPELRDAILCACHDVEEVRTFFRQFLHEIACQERHWTRGALIV